MDINSYGSAMGKIDPGTFVPDISPQLPKSEPLPDDAAAAGGPSFKDTLAGMIGNVNDQLLTAQQKSSDLALGKSNDVEGTVQSVEQASLGLEMTMAIRSKVLQAYTEINQMQF